MAPVRGKAVKAWVRSGKLAMVHPFKNLLQLSLRATFDCTTKLGSVTTMSRSSVVCHADCCIHRRFADKQGVRFTTEENGVCIYFLDGKLEFEGDGSSYSEIAPRIEPDDGFYVSFSLLTPGPTEDLV